MLSLTDTEAGAVAVLDAVKVAVIDTEGALVTVCVHELVLDKELDTVNESLAVSENEAVSDPESVIDALLDGCGVTDMLSVFVRVKDKEGVRDADPVIVILEVLVALELVESVADELNDAVLDADGKMD